MLFANRVIQNLLYFIWPLLPWVQSLAETSPFRSHSIHPCDSSATQCFMTLSSHELWFIPLASTILPSQFSRLVSDNLFLYSLLLSMNILFQKPGLGQGDVASPDWFALMDDVIKTCRQYTKKLKTKLTIFIKHIIFMLFYIIQVC